MKSGTVGFRPWFIQDCELAERVSQLPIEYNIAHGRNAEKKSENTVFISIFAIILHRAILMT